MGPRIIFKYWSMQRKRLFLYCCINQWEASKERDVSCTASWTNGKQGKKETRLVLLHEPMGNKQRERCVFYYCINQWEASKERDTSCTVSWTNGKQAKKEMRLVLLHEPMGNKQRKRHVFYYCKNQWEASKERDALCLSSDVMRSVMGQWRSVFTLPGNASRLLYQWTVRKEEATGVIFISKEFLYFF